MLRLDRREREGGGGSFNPRNEGPLIVGDSSRTRSGARGGGAFCGAAGAGSKEGSGEGEVGAGAGAALWVVPTGAGAGKSVAPHMPQKRFVPGFSLPQRGQRTFPLLSFSYIYIAYDILGVGCSAVRAREHQSLCSV